MNLVVTVLHVPEGRGQNVALTVLHVPFSLVALGTSDPIFVAGPLPGKKEHLTRF